MSIGLTLQSILENLLRPLTDNTTWENTNSTWEGYRHPWEGYGQLLVYSQPRGYGVLDLYRSKIDYDTLFVPTIFYETTRQNDRYKITVICETRHEVLHEQLLLLDECSFQERSLNQNLSQDVYNINYKEELQMAILTWDSTGKRLFETGVKNGVLFVMDGNGAYPLGVPWNGLIGVTESPSGAEPSPMYADDIKYLNLMSVEEFNASIEAYTYPDEFAVCDGSADIGTGVAIGQQSRQEFGMAYKTSIGNDVNGTDHGYKLHLIYGALASPSEKAFQTINDSPEAITFSWDITTTPVEVTGKKPTASVVIDSTKANAGLLATLEGIIFGTVGADPRLPLPNEIATIFASAAPSAIAMSTIVPADAATAIAVTANTVITFNNKVASEDIVMMTAAGVIVPVVKTWDATGKILTMDPTSNMAAATMHLVAIVDVIDIYGQKLATTVKKFTTA